MKVVEHLDHLLEDGLLVVEEVDILDLMKERVGALVDPTLVVVMVLQILLILLQLLLEHLEQVAVAAEQMAQVLMVVLVSL